MRFAPGSDQGITVDTAVNNITVDGAGSVVVLDSPSPETLTGPSGQQYDEVVYNLDRFAPGSSTADPSPMDTGVSSFTVDGCGSVVALDSLFGSPNGIFGQLELFAPGTDMPQPMDVELTYGTAPNDGNGDNHIMSTTSNLSASQSPKYRRPGKQLHGGWFWFCGGFGLFPRKRYI